MEMRGWEANKKKEREDGGDDSVAYRADHE